MILRVLELWKGSRKKENKPEIFFWKPLPIKAVLVLPPLSTFFFSLMVKFDEVRTGGNMMPTATLAVGTTEGKISGK